MYVYKKNSDDPVSYSVGFFKPDGHFHMESEHDSLEAAAARVNYLNGGTGGAQATG